MVCLPCDQTRFPTRVSRLILRPVLPPPTWSAAHPSLLLNLPCQSSCCCSPVYPYSTLHPCPGCSCLSRFVLPDLFTFSTYSSSTLYKQPCIARSSAHPTQHYTPAVCVTCVRLVALIFQRSCIFYTWLPSHTSLSTLLHILTSITISHEQSAYNILGFFCSQSLKLNCITPKFDWNFSLATRRLLNHSAAVIGNSASYY